MKNRTPAYFFLVLSLSGIGYFVALQLASPGVFSFSYVWLVAGILFLAAFFLFRRPGNGKKSSSLFCSWCRMSVRIRRILAAVLAAGCITAVVCLYFILTPRLSDGTERIDYLIVLGGGIQPDGNLGPVPQCRLEKAAVWLEKHPSAKVIVTGGKGFFAPCAEAPVLARGLAALGISRNRILEENRASDTIQNFSYSAVLAARDSGLPVRKLLEEPVAVVTSDYHLARAERIAEREGFRNVYGIASETPPLFILNSYCREICAYVKLELRILLTGKPAHIAER